MRTRVICFGNDVMCDDGAGIHVAQALRERLMEESREADVVESAVAGYALLDLMKDWDRIVMVEAVKLPDLRPGEVVRLDPRHDATQLRLCSARDAGIKEILDIGRKLGHHMPDEVVLFAIQGEELCAFGKDLSPPVQNAVPKVVEEIIGELG